MNFKLTGHHLEITPPLRRHVAQRLERLLRHFDHVLDAQVTLSVGHGAHRAEATLQVRGNRLHAGAEGGDMYAAIDLLADKLDRQILKHKEKRKDHHQAQVTHHQLN